MENEQHFNSKAEGREDQFQIQKEMLELCIKAGRRLMHDYQHMLNEVPDDNFFKKEYRERGDMWKNIFYPDDGIKNYRSTLHQAIMNLEFELDRAKKLLKEHGIDTNPDEPF